MMVSPKAAQAAGDKFGLKPVCAGPYKFVGAWRRTASWSSASPTYWDKGRVHIERIVYTADPGSTVRLANLKSGGLDLIERMLATDIGEGIRTRSSARHRHPSRLQGITINLNNGEKSNNPWEESEGAPGLELSPRPRRDQPWYSRREPDQHQW